MVAVSPCAGLTAPVVLAVSLWTCTAASSVSGAATVREEVLQPGGQRVTVALPDGYEAHKPVPLVLALHFGGKVTPFFGRAVLTNLVEPALRKLGAVIVAPDCTTGTWANEKSEADVLAVLEYVRRTWSVDPGKTLITGYSLGGIGTWALAARHQDLFRAAVVVSGSPPPGVGEVAWRIPLYVIHSRDDEVILLKPTAAMVDRLKAAGAPVTLVVVDGVTHYQVGGFVPHLRAAIPWIKKAWKRGPGTKPWPETTP